MKENDKTVPFIICSLKTDLRDNEDDDENSENYLTYKDGKDFSEKHNANLFFELSSKYEPHNVKNLFIKSFEIIKTKNM
jgi:hypothetical protein